MRDPDRRVVFFKLLVALAAFSMTNAFPGGEIIERLRRYIINDHEVTVNVEWLTDEQLSELGTLDSPAQVSKIRNFYEQLASAEERRAAANKIVTQCHDWLPEVTTEAERSELKRLHRANHTACAERIAEYIGRLAAHRQTHLRRYWSFCEHVANDTAAEAQEVHEEEEELLEDSEPTDHKPTVQTTTEVAELDDDEETNLRQTRAIINPIRVRRAAMLVHSHHHNHDHTDGHEPFGDLEECFKSHLDWLTDEQKDKLRQNKNADKSQIQHIVFGFYDRTTGEARQHATEALKDYCSHLFRDIFGADNAAAVEKLRADGASSVDVSAAVQRYYENIEDADQKAKARERLPECTKLFGLAKETEGTGRKRRDVGQGIDESASDPALALDQAEAMRYKRHDHSDPNHIHDHKEHHDLSDYYKTHLAWLTDAQKDELTALKTQGKTREDLQTKIQEYYGATTGETRQKATELLKAGCIELFKSLFGTEKLAEIKKLKESGTSVNEIAAKIDGFKSELDAEKKAKADQYGPQCKRLFVASESPVKLATASRRRRSAIHAMAEAKRRGPHGHPDYPAGHADWLSDAQLDALRAARDNGADILEIQARLFDMYWEIPTKSQRIRANFHLKRDCLGYFTSIVSELTDRLAALDRRQDELNPRDVLFVLDRILDAYETHRQGRLWVLYHDHCSRMFSKPSSKESHELKTINAEERILDSFRQAFDIYVQRDPRVYPWLSDAQRTELEARPDSQTDDDRIELLKQLLAWQNRLNVIGDPNSKSRMAIESTIEMKRTCVNIAVWFTMDLKNTLNAIVSQRNMNPESLDDAQTTLAVIHDIDRVFNVIRVANSNRLLKESMALCGPLLHDTTSVRISRRQRRDADGQVGHEDTGHVSHHGSHSLDDYFKTHLAWLSNSQKDELRALKAEGKSRTELQAKVMQFYESTSGETRQKATELLKGGCIELFKAIFGHEKFEEVKKLKEDGTPIADIVKKVDEFSAALTNEHQKAQLKEYGPQCRSFFAAGAPPASATRRRRSLADAQNDIHVHDHGHHSLQDYLSTHLSWLTDAQKEELTTLKASGADRTALYAKVVEYYEATTGETREKATTLLKGACREFFVGAFGEEKLAEIKKLKADGKTGAEIASAIEGFVSLLTDEAKRTKAKLYIPYCKKLYVPEASRRRRDHHTVVEAEAKSHGPSDPNTSQDDIATPPTGRRRREAGSEAAAAVAQAQAHDHDHNHQLKDYYSTHLAWLEDGQKAELEKLKSEGKDVKTLTTKIQEYYASATGERKDRATALLKAGCTELFTSVFGAEKLAEIKRLKETGTSIDEISAQVEKFQADLTDPTKKARAEQYGPYCKRLFTATAVTPARPARSLHVKKHRSLLDYLETHFSWLSDSQKKYLQDGAAKQWPDNQITWHILRYYSNLSTPRRIKALRQLSSVCTEWYTDVFGASKMAELKRLMELADQEQREKPTEFVDKLLEEIPEGEERDKAYGYVSFCRRINADEKWHFTVQDHPLWRSIEDE